ncbi:MAG: transposase [Acidobacteriota bacterium]
MVSLLETSCVSGRRSIAREVRKALTRYLDDGHLKIDDNAGEHALRGVALALSVHRFPVQVVTKMATRS